MSDRELLELAAKAAGLMFDPTVKNKHGLMVVAKDAACQSEQFLWNPLTDDGDALRLAVKCGLVVDCSRPSAGEPYKQHAVWLDETMSSNELTRRAIVRAAAEIGRSMT